jgi:hypothetical protein
MRPLVWSKDPRNQIAALNTLQPDFISLIAVVYPFPRGAFLLRRTFQQLGCFYETDAAGSLVTGPVDFGRKQVAREFLFDRPKSLASITKNPKLYQKSEDH